jgi:glycerophosphoryl diester phosphodiesterase
MNIVTSMKLLPNTLDGLKWGLNNFDGVEFDIRLSKENDLVIHHDPITSERKIIAKMSINELKNNNLFLFQDFLNDEDILSAVSSGRTLWIELKPNCKGKKIESKSIAEKMYRQIINELEATKFPKNNIRILSFSKDLLDPIAQDGTFPCYPILPSINECNPKFITLQGLPRVIFKSLKSHIIEATQKNYRGVLFARQYIFGPIALRHPSYQNLVKMMDEYDIELGSNLGSVELEPEFERFHRFSDKTHIFPRFSKKGHGQIIAHRGTGTKGINISDVS